MNVTLHRLDELEVPQGAMKEALRAVLHTILFSRALGPVIPVEQRSAVLGDVCYLKSGDVSRGRPSVEVEKTVEESIEHFCHSLRPVGPELARGKLVLSFYERRSRKTFFASFSNAKEKVYWEQWDIPVLVNLTPQATGVDAAAATERERTLQQVRDNVREALFKVIELVNESSDHIPPTSYHSDAAIAFPFEITVPRNKDAAESWLTKMLHSGPMSLAG